MNQNYAAVITESNLIKSVTMHTDLDILKKNMHSYLEENGFDREVDDARIFNWADKEVYTFPDAIYDVVLDDHYSDIKFSSHEENEDLNTWYFTALVGNDPCVIKVVMHNKPGHISVYDRWPEEKEFTLNKEVEAA